MGKFVIIKNLLPLADYTFDCPFVLTIQSNGKIGIITISGIQFIIKAKTTKGVILRTKKLLAMLVLDWLYGQKSRRSYLTSKFPEIIERLKGEFK